MKEKYPNESIYSLRENCIRLLSEAENSTQKAREIAENLFSLDLTVYSKNFTLESLIYSSFAKSILDDTIVLHPEQILIIQKIRENNALIVSAPTSFGKTFCVFEYIARHLPQNIVLIVPTLALLDEYVKRIVKKYKSFFSNYRIYTNISEEKTYDFTKNNIFIITHDRAILDQACDLIEKIDLLVIDEIYKLETDKRNDRVLVLNMAYYHLARKSNKYILLAPFIRSVEDLNFLDKNPTFYGTSYSPVVNEVKKIEILNDDDRYPECQRLLLKVLPNSEKTLIYFPTVTGIYKYVNDYISKEPKISIIDRNLISYLKWAREEIHENWAVIKAIERGYLVHNGQIPIGTRMFQLESYENNTNFNRLLCTSTLLEGINTTSKNIIITKPSRSSESRNNADNKIFSAFDFYNLVGRTGRLNKHYVGTAYYLKGNDDINYEMIDAIKSIKFELTDESQDIDLQTGDIEKHQDIKIFLNELGITVEEYRINIGSGLRFKTVEKIYANYKDKERDLLEELKSFLLSKPRGRTNLVKILYEISEGKKGGLKALMLSKLLDKRRPKIKKIVTEMLKYFKDNNVDYYISTAISLKTSYIEHQFYSKLLIIKYFMKLREVNDSLIDVLNEKVISAIEYLYFTNSKNKKILLDLGVYERDVETISKIIGSDFEDVFQLKDILMKNINKIKNVSFISQYILRQIIQ